MIPGTLRPMPYPARRRRAGSGGGSGCRTLSSLGRQVQLQTATGTSTSARSRTSAGSGTGRPTRTSTTALFIVVVVVAFTEGSAGQQRPLFLVQCTQRKLHRRGNLVILLQPWATPQQQGRRDEETKRRNDVKATARRPRQLQTRTTDTATDISSNGAVLAVAVTAPQRCCSCVDAHHGS